MNRTQALRKAVKLFGKNATVWYSGSPTSHERRAQHRAEWIKLRDECNTPELKKANRRELDRLYAAAVRYSHQVGVIELGMFNSIKACGDSWEGCFRALELPHKGTAHEQQETTPA